MRKTGQTPIFVVVTGLSGAGKTLALRCFEDLGFYCVDNLPAALLGTFAELLLNNEAQRDRIAVCVDARTKEDLHQVPEYLSRIARIAFRPDVLYLDTSESVLLKRYSETRRRHPASPGGSIEEGIREERALLEPLRARADLILDTSVLSPMELRERIASTFTREPESQSLTVTVLSFGFKNGLPLEADMVFDLRFLPNPFYDMELRPLTGYDDAVRDYVLNNDTARAYLSHLKGLLKFLLPQFESEGKSYLTLAFGCTGGQHRSVAVAQEILRLLRDLRYDARLRDRDVVKL